MPNPRSSPLRLPLTALAASLALTLCASFASSAPRPDAPRAALTHRATLTTPPVTAEARARLLDAARDPALPAWQRRYMESLAARGTKRERVPQEQSPPPGRPRTLAGCATLTTLFPNTEALTRAAMKAVYDPVRDRMVIFGGRAIDGNLRNDVWVLSLAGTPTWSLLAPAGTAPDPREAYTAIYDSARDRIIYFGGYSDAGVLDEMWSLALATPAWTQLAPAGGAPEARAHASAIYDVTRDRMILFGGEGLSGLLSDTWALQFGATDTWTQLAPGGTTPLGRTQHTAVYDAPRDRMIVFGGADDLGNSNAVWSLALAGSTTWTELAPTGTLPATRYGHTAVFDAPRNRMLVYAGYADDPMGDSGDTDELWSLALSGSLKWTKLAPSGVPPATEFGAAIYDPVRQRLVAFGGYGAAMDEVWAVGLSGGSPAWTQLAVAGQPPRQRDTHTAIYDAPRHRLVAFGGYGIDGAPKNDVWTFDLAGAAGWTLVVPTGTRPSARYGHTAIFDASRNRMVIFGGYDGFNDVNDVWALSLSGTPAWTHLNPSGTPPDPRENAAAIYDAPRDRMVLFGGSGNGDVWALSFSGGGAWTQLAPAGGPIDLPYYPAAMFDPVRNRMLIFGGGTSDTVVWALALAGTPTWTVLSTTGTAPNSFANSKLVYDATRDRMLLYNEIGDLFALTLGATPAWSQYDANGTAPDSRGYFTMIYDTANDRAVVQGGYNGSEYNDVFAFSFPTNAFNVSVAVDPELSGTVTRSPDQFCFASGTTVTLTAVPETGYAFANWSGDASGTDNPLTITVGSDKNLVAHFVTYPLVTAADPVGSGSVTRDPYQDTYAPGSTVTLTVVEDQGFPFTGWSGDATGNANPLTVVMDGPKTIYAHFLAYPLTASTSPLGSGTVTKNPDRSAYAPGAMVLLTATPIPGVTFTGWSGDASGTDNPLTIVMDGPKNVVATFAETPPSCGGWSRIFGPGPSPRRAFGALYDAPRNRLIVFGGYSEAEGYLNDVWALSLSSLTWSPVAPTGTPPSKRDVPNVIYDPVRDRLLLIGGNSEGVFLSDVWSLSLADSPAWKQLQPSGTPPVGHYAPSAVYDPVRDRALVFGGYSSTTFAEANDLYELALGGATPAWSALGVAGPPTARFAHHAIYDPVRDRMVVFGGQTNTVRLNDTWTLDLAGTPQWTHQSPYGRLPAPRSAAVAVYDPERDRMIVFGGQTPFGYLEDTWVLSMKYSPPAWAELTPHGAVPLARGFHGAVFDPVEDQLVVFGGYNYIHSPPNLDDASRLLFADGNALDVAADGPNMGTVTKDLPRSCYPPGETVTLTAAPQPGYLFDHWSGDASGTTNPVSFAMDGHKAVVAHFVVGPTATLLAQFEAAGRDDGVELRWRFGDPARVATVAVERATLAAGPWSAAAIEARDEGGVTVALDRAVEPGGDYFYRLLVTLRDGSSAVFGPISTRTGERITESAITRLAPNPSSGATQVQFAVARAGRVRLTVIDVAGRVVATLADGVHRPGRYTAAWDGATRAGRITAGVYYLRLSAPDRNVVRRLAVVR